MNEELPEHKRNWSWSARERETEAQWIARGGQLDPHGFDAIDFGNQKKSLRDLKGEGKQQSPEHVMWTNVLMIAVSDALGFSGSDVRKQCIDCHIACEDGCFPDPEVRYIRPKKTCTWKPHTIQQCALNYIYSDECRIACELAGVEVSYFRKLFEAKKQEVRGMQRAKQPQKTYSL